MGRYQSLFGLIGLIAFLFGLIAFWLTGEPSLYVLFHLLLGIALRLASGIWAGCSPHVRRSMAPTWRSPRFSF